MELWTDYRRFQDRFREALDPRLYPIEYLDALVWSGIAQFLCTDDAAIVFNVKTYPAGTADVHGLIAAGNMEAIVEKLIPRAEQWGREHGCQGALIKSREGWVRALKDHGYEPHQIAVRKEL